MAYATCKLETEGTVIREGDGGIVLTERYQVDNITTDADYIFFNANNNPMVPLEFAKGLPDRDGRDTIPQRGDQKLTTLRVVDGSSTIVYLYCIDKRAMHYSKSKNSAFVDVTYVELGIRINSTGAIADAADNDVYLWLAGAQVNGTTIATNTSFQWGTVGDGYANQASGYGYGKPMQVYYKPATPLYDFEADGSLATNIASGIVRSQYVQMPSLESMSTIGYRTREIARLAGPETLRSIQAKQKYFNGSTNVSEIWGYPAYSLRLRVMTGEFDSFRSLQIVSPDDSTKRLRVWETLYQMEYRQRGWKEIATIKDPYTNYQYPDIDNPGTGIGSGLNHGNGWMAAVPLVPRAFSELGLPDLREL
jgi:hypothetical protein